MPFAEEASNIGAGIAGFLNPIIGKHTTVTESTTKTPTANSGKTTTIVIIGLVVVAIIAWFVMSNTKPQEVAA